MRWLLRPLALAVAALGLLWVVPALTQGIHIPLPAWVPATIPGSNGQLLYNNNGVLGATATPAPNILINPGMEIDQVNEGATVNATGTLIDGWRLNYTHPGSYTLTSAGRSTAQLPTGFQYAINLTVGTGASANAGDLLFIQQRVEANNFTASAFGTAAALNLSYQYWAYSSVAGTYSAAFVNAASNRSYVTTCTLLATTWTFCSGVIPGDTTGTWVLTGTASAIFVDFTPCAGSTFQTAPNAWTAGNFVSATGNTFLCATSSATFYVTGVKVEVNTGPTPFVRRSFGDEMLLAQRYYQKTFPLGTAPAQSAGLAGALCGRTASTTAGTFSQGWRFATPMRIAPTVTTYNPSQANANWRSVTGTSDVAVQVDVSTAIGTTGVEIGTQTTALTAAHDLCIHATADARL